MHANRSATKLEIPSFCLRLLFLSPRSVMGSRRAFPLVKAERN